ncbi:MAG: single-stranded DNA-binding protein [Bdellovibrionaceae bacterium]|nr:single-stranded DNA-binding protein [Pseudobdellovibrionaceae bacterium]
MTINRVFLSGRLGQNPELKKSESGSSFAVLKIATQRYFIRDADKRDEMTDWHDVFVWGRLGESCHKYLSKGQLVSIEGYLKNYKPALDSYEKHSRSIIQALQVDFLSPKPIDQNLTKSP